MHRVSRRAERQTLVRLTAGRRDAMHRVFYSNKTYPSVFCVRKPEYLHIWAFSRKILRGYILFIFQIKL
jgi:hypothetical protein